jgi:tetratricopeptide (TPR) repeat protein
MSLDRSQTFGTVERHLADGRITAAIEEYRKLVDGDPADITTLNTLGDLYVRAGLNNEAKRIFWRVALGYSQLGFTSKAIAVFKKLLRIDANEIDSALHLAECYLSQGLRAEAARHFNWVATASERSGRLDQSLAAYQRITEIDPSNADILMKLGDRWLSYGLIQRAFDSFSAAGRAYSQQGEDERALDAHLKAEAVRSAAVLAELPEISEATKDLEHDNQIFSESLERNSDVPEPNTIIGPAELSAARLDEVSLALDPMITLDYNEYSTPGSNRRRAERIAALVPIVVISEDGGWREFTQTVDVSEGGLKFQLAHAVPPMTVLRVSVNLERWPANVPKTWVMTDTEGIVCYCEKRPSQSSLVGFDLLAPTGQIPIEDLLQSCADTF